jgi:hypothetical protein
MAQPGPVRAPVDCEYKLCVSSVAIRHVITGAPHGLLNSLIATPPQRCQIPMRHRSTLGARHVWVSKRKIDDVRKRIKDAVDDVACTSRRTRSRRESALPTRDHATLLCRAIVHTQFEGTASFFKFFSLISSACYEGHGSLTTLVTESPVDNEAHNYLGERND